MFNKIRWIAVFFTCLFFVLFFADAAFAQSESDAQKMAAESFMIQGMTRAFQQDYPEAIELYQKALKATPEEPAILAALTEAHLALRNFTSAVFYGREMLRLAPDNEEYVRLLAETQHQSGDNRSGIETLNTFLGKFPQQVACWKDMADLQIQSNDVRSAVASYEKLATLRPESATIQAKLLDLYEKNGDWAKLIPVFEETLRLDPQNIDTRFKLNEAYRRTGRPVPTSNSVTITIAPTPAGNTLAQAKLLFAQNANDAAARQNSLQLVEQALTQEPNNADAQILKGKLLFLNDQAPDAVEWLTKGLRKNPRDLAAWAMAVQAATRANNPTKALSIADEAEFLFIGQPVLMLAKVEAFMALGKSAEAKSLLTEAEAIIKADFPNDEALRTQFNALKTKM